MRNLVCREVDIWAIGCLYCEMRTGDPIFPGESDIDQLYLITQILGMISYSSVGGISFQNGDFLPGPLSNRHRQMIARNPMFSGLNIQVQNNHTGLPANYPDW